jgi:hypothetical protein
MIHDTVLNYGCTVFRDAIVTDEQYPIYSIPNSAQPTSVNSTDLLQCSIYSIWLLQYPKSGCTVTLAYSIRPTAPSYGVKAHSANLAHWTHFGVVTHTVLVYSFRICLSSNIVPSRACPLLIVFCLFTETFMRLVLLVLPVYVCRSLAYKYPPGVLLLLIKCHVV